MQFDPYAPPKADLDLPPTTAESIRTAHISHEASIKAVGFLYLLSGGSLLVAAVVMLGAVLPDARGDGDALKMALFAGFLLVLAGLTLAVGYGLRRLKSWCRIPVAIFSGLGMINFPVGTLINAYILYLVFSAKGRMVLSAPYAEAVAQTPEIRYRTSAIVWVFLGFIIVLLAAIFIPLMMKGIR